MYFQWNHLLYVGLGGMMGSVLRYSVSTWMAQHATTGWPWGTFLVNLAGCFLIGMVLGFPLRLQEAPVWKLFLATGFCGGFTTFSAFSNEGFQMLKQQYYFLFAAYAFSSVLLGLLAVVAGYWLIRFLF